MMKKRLILLSLGILLVFMSACNDSTFGVDTGETKTIRDMADREIEVKNDIKRVVAHQWGSADIVISVLGEEAMDCLVAVGNSKSSAIMKALYAEKYPQIAEMPNIGGGGGGSYDLEKITSLKPDVFIVDTNSVDKIMDTVNDLEKVGIPSIILTLSAEPMRTPQQGIKIIGELFDKEERAKEITDFIDEQFALIESKKLSEKENKPTVYMEKGSGSSTEYDVTFASKGGWDSIIEFAGGENIAKDSVGNSTQIDPEYLITQDPDFIVIAGAMGFGEDKNKGTGVLDEYSQRKGWDKLSAVQNGNFYEISHGQERNQMCFYPSLFLSKIFYPEEFEDIDPTARLKEFYDRFMLLDFEEGVWSIQREVL